MVKSVIQIKSGIAMNVDLSVKNQNPATRSCEIGKYLASIIDDSVIT